MKKKRIILFVVLLLVGWLSVTIYNKLHYVPPPPTQKQLEASKRHNRPTCPKRFVEFEIAGHLLRSDAEPISARQEDGTEFEARLDCDISLVTNVQSIQFMNLAIVRDYSTGSEYQHILKFRKSIGKEVTFAKTYGGYGYARFEKTEMILLPQTDAPTANGEPVAFTCQRWDLNEEGPLILNYCNTVYQHPDGLWLSYWFSRKEGSPSTLLAYDQKQRAFLNSIIVKQP